MFSYPQQHIFIYKQIGVYIGSFDGIITLAAVTAYEIADFGNTEQCAVCNSSKLTDSSTTPANFTYNNVIRLKQNIQTLST